MERVKPARADKEVTLNPRTLTAGPVALLVAFAVLGAGIASAQVTGPGTAPGGGTTAPTDPQISGVQCLTRCIGTSTGVTKSKVKIFGTDLSATTVVSFPRADGCAPRTAGRS